jgi:hypothetical protein
MNLTTLPEDKLQRLWFTAGIGGVWNCDSLVGQAQPTLTDRLGTSGGPCPLYEM